MKTLIIISVLATGFCHNVFAQFSQMKEKRTLTAKETKFLMKNGIYIDDYDWRDNKTNYHLNLGLKYKKQAKIYYIAFAASAIVGSVMTGAGVASAAVIPGSIILSASLPMLGIGISKGGKAGRQFNNASRMIEDYEPYRKRNIEDYYVPYYLHNKSGLPAAQNSGKQESSLQFDQLIKEVKAMRETFEDEITRLGTQMTYNNNARASSTTTKQQDDYAASNDEDDSESAPDEYPDDSRLPVPCYVISCGVLSNEAAAKVKVRELQQKGLKADYFYIPDYDR